MLSFESDYIEGCHEQLLKRLAETNLEQLSGYGADSYTECAKQKIKAACACETADVHFLLGGTQTNQIVIDTMLKPYEGVIAAKSGHISVHEAGAIEMTGHKVLQLEAENGKIVPEILRQYMQDFWEDGNHEHMVFPGMVYISHPTEYGTLYTKDEMMQISAICRQYQLPLYLDGARLGYGLMADHTEVTLPFIAEYCDIFYIGGTKVGALCGEAVVFTKNNTPAHFLTLIKQHGALLAKGRLLGIQFDTLFTDELYFKISRHAIQMAERLKKLFKKYHYTFFLESDTNQQFIILEQKEKERLEKEVTFSFWEIIDKEHAVYRFATSWATKEADIDKLEEILSRAERDKV